MCDNRGLDPRDPRDYKKIYESHEYRDVENYLFWFKFWGGLGFFFIIFPLLMWLMR